MFAKEISYTTLLMICVISLTISACAGKNGVNIEGESIRIGFDKNLHSRIFAKFDNHPEIPLGDFVASESVTSDSGDVSDFAYTGHTTKSVEDSIGKGTQYRIVGDGGGLEKQLTITLYPAFPHMAVFDVQYTNKSDKTIRITGWTNNRYSISASGSAKDIPPFWTYQSGSYESRPDWVLPINPGFKQQNYMGMNASDYGGGTPVSDIWRPDAGLGVGHLELVPKLVSIPVNMSDSTSAQVGVEYKIDKTLRKGEALKTLTTFVAVHQGDYFATLDSYRQMMVARGMKPGHWDDAPYEPVWCAWGYERNFTMPQIYGTLPKVKELGYKWAVLDDGWQTAEGDWYLNREKFPRGDADMQEFVRTIKGNGLKAKLWWAPLSVDPGTDLIENHPEYLLLNKDGSKQKISWWDAYYLCPAYKPVQENARQLVRTIMGTWGYEGLKIDGQHLNGAPPCYNEAHHHAYPEEAVEKVPEYFKVIYETALEIDPDAVVELCPCGTAFSFFNLPYINQTVSSDPESSWQIRTKGKTFKALMGSSAPYYGDHVELSDSREDFASTVGVGGIPGTKFTWPVGSKKDSGIDLTSEKEKKWSKWTEIYLDKMLSKGTYLGGLYDIGFDKPETHAISKNGTMYYAFYAENWDGQVELRGLKDSAYRVIDYVNDKDHGTVSSEDPRLEVRFDKYLLLEATPAAGTASN